MGRLDGEVITVTGVGSGTGRASAILFAKEGAKAVAADRISETGERTTSMIRQSGGEAAFVRADVSFKRGRH